MKPKPHKLMLIRKITKADVFKSAKLVNDNVVFFLRKTGIVQKKKVYDENFNGKTVGLEESFTTIRNLKKVKTEPSGSEFPDNPNNGGFLSSSLPFR